MSMAKPIAKRLKTKYYYCSNLVYDNDNISAILFDGGYASVNDDNGIVMHFYVKDHLGSNRLVVDGNGNIEEVNHYYPFGALMGDRCGVSRNNYKYIGKELDTMYGWNMQDHEARWYDPVVGRWMVTDPLQEKYASVSSYCYTVNDPIRFIDTDGKIVRPNGTLAMSIILNTLPIDSRRYITLNKNGCLDLNLMNQYDGDSKNFNSLKTLVKSDYDIYITTLKSTKYVNDGRISIERFLPVEKVESFIDTDFTSCSGNITGETGNLGVTYMPANGGLGKSDADNPNSIHVNINPSLSPTGAAEAFSHEAYGHALIFVESGGNRNRAIHHYQGSHDANLELVNKSISARKETIKNMEDETLVNN